MKLLLDTCTFLWTISGAPHLSTRARDLFADPANDVVMSTASTWEIAVKNALGRLPLPLPIDQYIPLQRQRHGIDSLPIDEESALHVARLPVLHRDPFDRMLVAQAMVHGLVILTPDPLISQYPVRTAW
jgi:PIN domain nuclease of toxin-antitoxin system